MLSVTASSHKLFTIAAQQPHLSCKNFTHTGFLLSFIVAGLTKGYVRLSPHISRIFGGFIIGPYTFNQIMVSRAK
jgi:hypothetical protein